MERNLLCLGNSSEQGHSLWPFRADLVNSICLPYPASSCPGALIRLSLEASTKLRLLRTSSQPTPLIPPAHLTPGQDLPFILGAQRWGGEESCFSQVRLRLSQSACVSVSVSLPLPVSVSLLVSRW